MDPRNITLSDLLKMGRNELASVMHYGQPLNISELENTMYRGVDLSLPTWVNKILWKTFCKTFHRDPQSGVLRGWNVRLEQTGIEGPIVPMRRKDGQPLSFGHYHVLPRGELRFPKDWSGADYLDYRVAGNLPLDVARFATCPLVQVNAGSSELLLGWEVLNFGGLMVPLPDYWALVWIGPLDHICPVPKP